MNRNFLAFFLFLFCTILIVSCKGPTPTNNPNAGPVPVNLYKVQSEEASYFDRYAGTLIALNEVQVHSEVSGYMTGISFKDGQVVHKGQKLYEIERSKYVAAYNQADANVQIAKANLAKAQRDAERYTRLNQQEAIAKQTYEYALTALESTKSQVASAEAQLSSASTDLKHALITAPFDGTIGISQVKTGTFITAGQTLLNTISSDDPIAVDFVVSEKEIGRFIDLEKKPINKNDTTFTIQLADKSIYPYGGHIALIDRAVDPQTGTIKVRLSYPNSDRKLRSGMSCNVQVLNTSPHKQLLVPFKAVTEQMGEYFVYVVEGDTARQHKVALGSRVGDKIIVHEGLKVGDPIVVEGIQKLRDGAPVQVGTPQATAQQPGQPPSGKASAGQQSSATK